MRRGPVLIFVGGVLGGFVLRMFPLSWEVVLLAITLGLGLGIIGYVLD